MAGHRRLFTDQQLIELHAQGFNDREISEKIGVTPQAVGFHRKKLGLKPIRKHRTKYHKRKRLLMDQKLIELHAQGFNDREVGEKLGVSFCIVGVHRRRLGLEPIRKHRSKDYKRKRLFTDQQLIELHAQGFNDREISEKIGAHQNTVSVHRRRLKLKVHGHRKRLFTDQQLIELHAQGFNDREVGEKLGVTGNTVCRRRRGLGLKPVSRS